MSIEIKNVVVVEHEKEGALYADITAPLYWWNEFDVLNIGRTVKCDSIWSRITAKELSLKDFSCEYARKFGWSHDALTETIRAVNAYAKGYLTAKTEWVKREDMLIAIQLLPCSYNQKRTVIMDYKTLIDINLERENLKLDEWVYFCDWIKALPTTALKNVMENQSAKKRRNQYEEKM